MDMYDHKDFEQNPGKYRLFKSAVIAKHVHTENGEHDLHQFQHVCIAYRFDALNPLYRRREPVYTIVGTDRDLYANCLADFVL